MNIKEVIKNRITLLEQRNGMLMGQVLDLSAPASLAKDNLERMRENKAILNTLLALLLEIESAPPEVHPDKTVEFMTSAETKAFTEEAFGGLIQAAHDAGYDFMKTMQYFVNITAAQWNAGLIEKLEAFERLDSVNTELVDQWLHEAHANEQTLSENIAILAKELSL